ncbi:MAG: VapC toxin family PIN domain ribonuclease [Verrucomicrobia bacterium]|nr:VapC toxin family PIN domain ribonuclease [Verrucomicrobiota bacterium]
MITLLDASVLIALGDAGHEHENAALRFFENEAVPGGWATCPLTENAFLRILSQPRYPRNVGSPADARRILLRLLAAPGHQFWPDKLSLADTRCFPALSTSKHLTDLYLLGLAVKNGGRFATFDAGIDASLLPGGPAAYFIIPPS